MKTCNLCPNRCNSLREEKKLGKCLATKDMYVAKISLHKHEEPCIALNKGSGAIFFSACNLKCIYCQNYMISKTQTGKKYDPSELAIEMLKLQSLGAENINLVSPTIYIEKIIETLKIAKKQGLSLPVIYNTNGYENVESLKKLEGLIDVYLPDFKYAQNELGEQLSKISNYRENAILAITEMLRQKSKNEYDNNGKILSGCIIRHLVLPNHIANTREVLNDIVKHFGKDVYVSIMAQYYPCDIKACEKYKIARGLKTHEMNQVEEYMFKLGLSNGYIQRLGHNEKKYTPNF